MSREALRAQRHAWQQEAQRQRNAWGEGAALTPSNESRLHAGNPEDGPEWETLRAKTRSRNPVNHWLLSAGPLPGDPHCPFLRKREEMGLHLAAFEVGTLARANADGSRGVAPRLPPSASKRVPADRAAGSSTCGASAALAGSGGHAADWSGCTLPPRQRHPAVRPAQGVGHSAAPREAWEGGALSSQTRASPPRNCIPLEWRVRRATTPNISAPAPGFTWRPPSKSSTVVGYVSRAPEPLPETVSPPGAPAVLAEARLPWGEEPPDAASMCPP